jgi:hypothetical protein
VTAAEILRTHAAELEKVAGFKVTVVEEGQRLYVLIEKVPLPCGGFQVDLTDVLVMTDNQYPYSAMDMFWTELGVLLKDGRVPKNAESVENYISRSWRRFSWHRNQIWNPGGNPLMDHFAFVESRLVARE